MADERKQQDRGRELEKKDVSRDDRGGPRNKTEVSFDRPIPPEKPKKD